MQRQILQFPQEPQVDVRDGLHLLGLRAERGTPRAGCRSARRPLEALDQLLLRAAEAAVASSSRLRIAFANACWNVRPNAIASPTDFMCVDSR